MRVDNGDVGCGDNGGEGSGSTAGTGDAVRPRTLGTRTISSVSNVRASTTCSREVC